MMGFFIGDGWIEETKKSDGRSMNKIRFCINDRDCIEVCNKISCIIPITDKKNKSSKSCKIYGCADFIWFNILRTQLIYVGTPNGKFVFAILLV